MSVWYQLEVEAIGNQQAIGKFINLNPKEDVYIDNFKFSFGQKNAPGLRLWKIMQQNPDLIFLTKMSVECDTVQWHLEKFDAASGEHRRILIQDFGPAVNRISKKVLEDYEKALSGLAVKHLNGEKGFEELSMVIPYDSR